MGHDTRTAEQSVIGEKRQAPLWLLLPLALILSFNVIQLFVGAWLSSPTSDASTYVLWLQNLLTNGSYSFPDSGTHEGHGPISAVLQHASAVLLGTEAWSQTQWTPEANAARHVAIAVMSAAGLAAAGICTWLITHSWRWGLVSAAALSAIPSWTGHGMFNTTDVPAATGYTLFTASAIVMVRTGRRVWSSALGAFALAWLGWVLAFGSRPGLWPALMVSVGLVGALAWFNHPGHGVSLQHTLAFLRSIAPVLSGSVIGYATLWLVDPRGHGNIASTLQVAVTSSSRFPYSGSVLVNGRIDTMPPRRTYILEWFVHQLPLVILVAGSLFIGLWSVMLSQNVLSKRRTLGPAHDATFLAGSSLVIAQASILPLVGLILGSTFYNGTRQLLFVLPALAVLATLGLISFQAWSTNKFRQVGYVSSALVIIVAVAAPSLAQWRLFPYNYVYFNPVAEIRGVDNEWSVDYWRSSTRELVRMTPAGVPRDCDAWSGSSLDQCADYPDYSLYANEAGKDAGPSEARPNQYYLMRYTEFGTTLPDMCRAVDAIERPLTFTNVTVGVLGICDFPLTEQVAAEFDFKVVSEASRGRLFFDNDAVLLWGWQVDPLLGVWANWDTAGLGFKLSESFRGRALELQLDGHLQTEDLTPRELHVMVNGREVGSALFGNDNRNSTQSFVVPIEVANRLDGDFVIELSDPSRPRGPLVYLLRAVRLTERNGFGNVPS